MINIKLPQHIALTIEFNPHLVYYMNAEEYIKELFDNKIIPDFISDEDKTICIKNNVLISVFWYPTTPIGHCQVVGSSLEKILSYINE